MTDQATTRKQVEAMVLAIIKRADYDLWKALNPETSEDHELAELELNALVRVALEHLEP